MFLGDYLAMSASVGVFYFPVIAQIITGIYFPQISQIITDLNRSYFSFASAMLARAVVVFVVFNHPAQRYLPCPSVSSVGVISPSFTLYTLHHFLCHPWELHPLPLHFTPYTTICAIRGRYINSPLPKINFLAYARTAISFVGRCFAVCC